LYKTFGNTVGLISYWYKILTISNNQSRDDRIRSLTCQYASRRTLKLDGEVLWLAVVGVRVFIQELVQLNLIDVAAT